MTITINGTSGITTPEVTLDNAAADGGQVVLKSSGYSNWNLDNYSGRFRGYYGSTEYFTVDSSGNMGIGTSSPTAKLDVNTSINLTAQNYLNVAYDAGGGLGWVGGYNTTYSSGVKNVVTGALSATFYGSSGIQFYTNASAAAGTAATERARIDSSGNLLVGTTTNSFSSTNYGIVLNPNSESFWVANTASNLIAFNINTNNNIFKFFRSGTQVGAVSVTTTNTTYATSSDYRLKNTIAPMTGALAKVAALKPVTYKWNVDDSDGEGFIAHELAEVIPQAVVGEKDGINEDGTPKYQGIDTSFLVATLTAAIQEQQAIIQQLTARIEALENK